MQQSRRIFIKWVGVSLASLPFFAGAGGISKVLAAGPELPPLKPTDPTAKSLGFCLNAKKPNAQCIDRKAADKKDQFCSGCQLYTKVKGDGATEMGKCLVLTAGLVPAGGWCKSWVKRPT